MKLTLELSESDIPLLEVKTKKDRQLLRNIAIGKYDKQFKEPWSCESCPYCQIRHLKKVTDNSYRCKIFKFRECWDEKMKSIYNDKPQWCPLRHSEPIRNLDQKQLSAGEKDDD